MKLSRICRTIVATAVLMVVGAEQAGASVQAIANGSQPIELEVHRGKLVRLSQPAAAIFVADPTIADLSVKSPTLVYVMAKKAGETSLFAVDENDEILADVRLITTHNLGNLGAALARLLPGAVIETSSVAGGLLLTGAVATATEAEQAQRIALEFIAEDEDVINQLQLVGPNQVNLRVRIAEVSREVTKRFGVNFDIISTIGDVTFGLFSGSAPLDVFGNLATRTDGANNASFQYASGDVNVDALVDALEEEGLLTLLAEPNLTALNGETASFLAGGEFPIPVPQDNGNVTIEFKKFGVALAFTPTILDSGRISLAVVPEVSALSSAGAIELQGFTIPALSTRRADTTVELGSGQSLAIAGLLQNETKQDIDEFPGLADLPIIGTLFRSTEFQNDETELVIIVTPILVRPVSATLMATPVDGFVPADDFSRIVKGETRQTMVPSTTAVPRGPGAEGLTGPVGFILN
ncbi:MAG: type II and III secretion system protein family protein [Alphaproteobacteria bacterium]